MIDWRHTMADAESWRDELLREAQRDRVLADQSGSDEGMASAEAGRPTVLGVLITAFVVMIATGALAPR